MKTAWWVALWVVTGAGCFIEPVDVLGDSTPELCTGAPTTCGTNLLGSWTLAQSCELDKTYPSCPKYEWSLQAVGTSTWRFGPNGVVDLAEHGRLASTIVFDKSCSETKTCEWSTSIPWSCVALDGNDCQCKFDVTNNVSFDNRYRTDNGVLTLNDTVEDYLQIRYCVDGDSLYFLYDHGGYQRYRRG